MANEGSVGGDKSLRWSCILLDSTIDDDDQGDTEKDMKSTIIEFIKKSSVVVSDDVGGGVADSERVQATLARFGFTV